MGVFQFRLATLLRLREAERDERRMQLADAFQAEQIIRKHIDELDQGIQQHKEFGRKAAMPGKINVDQIVDVQRYEYQLLAERTVAEQRRQSILEEIERRRERLAAADKEVRILEKLRETKQVQFHAEEMKKEQKTFDELAGRVVATREEYEFTMGKLFGLIGGLLAYVCVATVISLCVFMFYAKSKGYMDPEKVAKMMAIARGEELASTKQAEAVKTEKSSSEPTFDMREQQFQLRDMRIKLREAALKTERDNLADERHKLTDERSKFDLNKGLYEEQAKNFVNSVILEGRDNIRKIWENIKPKMAKELMLIMIANHEINEVAKIFSSVPTTKQAKIIAEFRTPDEQTKLNEVLQLIRVPPTTQQPVGSSIETSANSNPIQ